MNTEQALRFVQNAVTAFCVLVVLVTFYYGFDRKAWKAMRRDKLRD